MWKAVAWLLVKVIAFHHTAFHLVVLKAQPVISPLCNGAWGCIVLAGGLKVHLSWILSCRWLFFPVSLSWRLLACTPDEKRTDNSVRSQPHKMRQVCVTWMRETVWHHCHLDVKLFSSLLSVIFLNGHTLRLSI